MSSTVFSFTIVRDPLLNALVRAVGIVERRNPVEILSCVHMKCGEDGVTIRATDLEMTVVSHLNIRVMGSGEVDVPAQMLHDVVRKLPVSSSLSFGLGNGHLRITSGDAEFNFPIISGDVFPTYGQEQFECEFKVVAGQFSLLFGKTRFAISSDDSRYSLGGVFMHCKDGALNCVATDGHRLATVSVKIDKDLDLGIIIPRKTVEEIIRILDTDGREQEEVVVRFSKQRVQFELSTCELSSKLIDGAFPDYERIIPKNNDQTVAVSARVLSDVIERVSVMITDKLKVVKLTFKQNKLLVAAVSTYAGNAMESIPVKYDKTREISIGLNVRYILEALKCVKSTCLISFSDSSSAITIRDEDLADFLCVIMPIRT